MSERRGFTDALNRLAKAVREGFEPIELGIDHIDEPGAKWALTADGYGSCRIFTFDVLNIPRRDAEIVAQRYAQAAGLGCFA